MKKFPKNPRLLLFKIKSYERFKVIARAIQLVSFAMIKRLKKKMDSRGVSLAFIKKFFQMIDKIDWLESELCKNITIMYITSDRSCCGLINNHVLKKINYFMDRLFNKNITLVSVGSTAYTFFKRKYRYNLKFVILDLEKERLTFSISYILSLNIFNTSFDRFFFLFSRYINPALQKLTVHELTSYELLWFQLDSQKQKSTFLNNLIEANKFTDILLEFYCFSMVLIILDSLEESDYSSHGARARTMENAFTNTDKVVSYLRLRYNKSRQAVITNEIIEVLNGSTV